MHLRVPQAVFESAWRETTFSHGGQVNYLSGCRNYRNRGFWEAIKDMQSQRAKEGLVHVGKGPRTEWEDVFCMVFGTSWREIQNSCSTHAEWRRYFPQFADTKCLRWSFATVDENQLIDILPVDHVISTRTGRIETKAERQVRRELKNLPLDHGEDAPEIGWDRGSCCFAFVVDCKPLADKWTHSTQKY